MADRTKKIIADTFLQMAQGLETGSFGRRPKIALTGLGSEHGEENAMRAALAAAGEGVEVIYIGTLHADGIRTEEAADDAAGHERMEALLEAGEADAAVTMHYPFPIGVSTVGRVVTPGCGREMFIATTTGTSSTDRIAGMVRNAVYGIITARACGIKNPTVGILNVDGARQAEIALRRLKEGGYDLSFAESLRAEGGAVMRGNDVLRGTPDILVTDPLTGNVLIKMLSAFTTGGEFESLGCGYGPGIGEDYRKLVMIISRASGAPLIKGAINFAAELIRGRVFDVAGGEFAAARKAGLDRILNELRVNAEAPRESGNIQAPPREVVTFTVPGIEIMDLEDGVRLLWKNGVYAESGMGCTGPVILVSEANAERSVEILRKGGYIS